MLSLKKSKWGFTLIELMVVVAIIGILALIGLRAYMGQIEKSKNAVVKANAGTVQTLIQAELADDVFASAQEAITDIGGNKPANMQNPYDESWDVAVAIATLYADETAAETAIALINEGADDAGKVYVLKLTDMQIYYIVGSGADGTTEGFDLLTAMR